MLEKRATASHCPYGSRLRLGSIEQDVLKNVGTPAFSKEFCWSYRKDGAAVIGYEFLAARIAQRMPPVQRPADAGP